MKEKDLWKYCTSEQVRSTLLSFHLLDGVPIEEEKYFSCLYAVSNHPERHYHPAAIPKRSGGARKLLIPDALLCRIQKNILRHVLAELPVSSYAKAYRPRSAVVENAKPHVGAKEILKLDIRNFFDSITFFQVYRSAFPAVYYPPAIRTLLTNLCCCKDALPQGAPTSPAVSNLVMKPFDDYMGSWCEKREVRYTRYCDDLTFSGEFDRQEVKNKVRGFLAAYGFELNEEKTRIQKKHQRQTVTGIVVNEKPQVSRTYRKKLRAEIYYCGKYGVESHLRRSGEWENWKKLHQNAETICVRYLQQLLGKVNFVLQVNPEDMEFCQAKNLVKEMLKEKLEEGERNRDESEKITENADGVEAI